MDGHLSVLDNRIPPIGRLTVTYRLTRCFLEPVRLNPTLTPQRVSSAPGNAGSPHPVRRSRAETLKRVPLPPDAG